MAYVRSNTSLLSWCPLSRIHVKIDYIDKGVNFISDLLDHFVVSIEGADNTSELFVGHGYPFPFIAEDRGGRGSEPALV